MNSTKKLFLILLFTLLAIPVPITQGQTEDPNKTLSPYFFVTSEDPSVDPLPLKSTRADVNVAGVIADVVVTQVYKNEGKTPIEAIYIFPASTRAAVYGMKMTIGERTIVAAVKEREEARRTYQEAKQQGKSASLLEQQRPNVFQMNVANILPGDVIQVELKYTELLIPTDGIYEFVHPTVVGPRYSNQSASGAPPSEKWVENPYLRQGKSPTYSFDIKINLMAGLPIQEMTCSSHKVTIHYDGPSRASVHLDPSETIGGNRDFTLKYQLAGGKIETGLLLSRGENEKFFLLRGVTGTTPYTNRIDIRKEKPSESNSALCYLWARHRVSLLSDYNVIRNNPDRVKEVIHLGLTYNLLTVYTSFVAIDTEIRVKGGEAVTVKQPLPLPQGVSDYAVGGKGSAEKQAALPSSLRVDSIIGSNRAAKKEVDKPMEDEKTGTSDERKGRIEIAGILTEEKQIKESVQKGVIQKISEMERCYHNALNLRSNLTGKVTLKISIDPRGKILKVSLVSTQLKHQELEQCILERIKGLNFLPSVMKKESTVTLILNFKSS